MQNYSERRLYNPRLLNFNSLDEELLASEIIESTRTLVIDFQGRNLKYNINADVLTFRELKKMIQVSTNNRIKLIRFISTENKELLNCDDLLIKEVFPYDNTINLKIKLAPKEAELDSALRKKYTTFTISI